MQKFACSRNHPILQPAIAKRASSLRRVPRMQAEKAAANRVADWVQPLCHLLPDLIPKGAGLRCSMMAVGACADLIGEILKLCLKPAPDIALLVLFPQSCNLSACLRVQRLQIELPPGFIPALFHAFCTNISGQAVRWASIVHRLDIFLTLIQFGGIGDDGLLVLQTFSFSKIFLVILAPGLPHGVLGPAQAKITDQFFIGVD